MFGILCGLLLLLYVALGQVWGASLPFDATTCPAALRRHIPFRSAQAMTGSAFARYAAEMDATQKEQSILTELLAGNMPAFLHDLKPVRLHHTFADGETLTAIVCVTPDYLAVGSNADFLRMPMNLHTAIAVARHFGFILPTRKIVDAIARQANYRLRPEPMQPGPQMVSVPYYRQHNSKIKAQRRALHYPLGALVAGHKKDLVLTNRLFQHPGRLAIYGWHRLNGYPIQPLSTVHGARYADYSHGIRLVSDTVLLNGEPWSIYDILQHSRLAKVLSKEGMIRHLRHLMGFET
jgi:hypothetical protein